MPKGRTIKLTLAYDGTDFAGWQTQETGRSVQAALEKTIEKITGERSSTLASGRTDAGVHALGQVVSFRTESQLTSEVLQRALNAELPRTMAVLERPKYTTGFTPRTTPCGSATATSSTTGRSAMSFPCVMPGTSATRDWMRRPCNGAAAALVGTHDFSSFETAGAAKDKRPHRL